MNVTRRMVSNPPSKDVPAAAHSSHIYLRFTFDASLLPLHPRRDLQPQRIESYEPRRVILVICLRRVGFHRGDGRVVEAQGRFAAAAQNTAFVELHAYGAGHV